MNNKNKISRRNALKVVATGVAALAVNEKLYSTNLKSNKMNLLKSYT